MSLSLLALLVMMPADDPGFIRFIVTADTGTGRSGQHRVAGLMADFADANQVSFVLLCGDNFYPRGVRSTTDPLWQGAFENVYTRPSLQIPFVAALGNHDHYGNPDAQVAYSRTSSRWVMPSPYYRMTRSFSGGTMQLFVLDTQQIVTGRRSAEAQLVWLDKQLAASQATWKFVAGHHAVYSSGPHGGNSVLERHLKPILDRHGVQVYFAGHDHTLELITPAGRTTYVVSGGGAGPDHAYRIRRRDPNARFAATGGGFATVRVSPEEFDIVFIGMDGNPRFDFQLHTKTDSQQSRGKSRGGGGGEWKPGTPEAI